MGARVVRAADAPPYSPPLHTDVDAVRLQGLEAGPTEGFWVGLSTYPPGSSADTAPAAAETVYVVLAGELVLTAGGEEWTLRPDDSAHLTAGTVRSLVNESSADARLLVVIGTAR